MFNINDVIQFTENHKWTGCFGYINEIKDCGDDIRYMICIPVPEEGLVFTYSMGSNEEFKYIGQSYLIYERKE